MQSANKHTKQMRKTHKYGNNTFNHMSYIINPMVKLLKRDNCQSLFHFIFVKNIKIYKRLIRAKRRFLKNTQCCTLNLSKSMNCIVKSSEWRLTHTLVIDSFLRESKFNDNCFPLDLIDIIVKFAECMSKIISNEDMELIQEWILQEFNEKPYLKNLCKDKAQIITKTKKIQNKMQMTENNENYKYALNLECVYYTKQFNCKEFHTYCDNQGPTLV